jgi:hypothetical protein
MHTGGKLVGWLLVVIAAGALVGGAYLFGLERGLFAPEHEGEVGRLLLADDEVQRVIARSAVDAMVEQIPALEVVRSRLDDAAFRVTRTDRYAEVFRGAVDLAYERAVGRGPAANRSVVLTLNDVVDLLGDDAVPLLQGVDLSSELGDRGVELLGSDDLKKLRQVKDAADRWALPLLISGVVLAVISLVIPGGRPIRAVALGALIAVGAALAFFSTDQVGDRLVARSTQPAAGVVHALWVSAAPSIRAWLGGAFMVGLLVIAAGLLVNAEHD